MALRFLASRTARHFVSLHQTPPLRRASVITRVFPNPFQLLRINVSKVARAMTTDAPKKFEWLVVVPDYPGALEKRLEVRPTHFANLQPNIDGGILKMGGALLSEVPKDDSPSSLKFTGSTLVLVASSREEVMDILKKDVYSKSEVWDLGNVQIWPFKCAVRLP